MNGRRTPGNGRRRVVIAGGGVAALETMLALRSLAPEFVQMELVAPEPHFWYRPLAVAEPFDLGRASHFELGALAHEAGAVFTPGAIAAVDAETRVARTSSGLEVPYDALVIACGAASQPSLDHALTFRGPADVERFRDLLRELETGVVSRLAFAVPAGSWWPLPLYELALFTAAHLAERRRGVELVIVSPEEQPLRLFGKAASEALGALLEERGIRLLAGRHVSGYDGSELALVPGPALETERVVTLPRLEGRPIEGVPHDADGFVPVDEFGRVRGLANVFAAGDITTFPLRQGGIAAQAADAVAETIAAEAGAPVTPTPFRPVLRGLLLTGAAPRFMRADVAGGHGDSDVVSVDPLWWPPGKIVGRYLAPVLARSLRYAEAAPPATGVPVQVDLSSLEDEGS
jgi:sulfide:quinone oxidoreductase